MKLSILKTSLIPGTGYVQYLCPILLLWKCTQVWSNTYIFVKISNFICCRINWIM